MTKTKHTPGRSGARAKTALRRYPCGCVAILTPDGPDWGACDLHHAAPDLLEAAKAMRTAFAAALGALRSGNTVSPAGMRKKWCPAWNALTAAIDNAEGKEAPRG